jgi:hypothetical protein
MAIKISGTTIIDNDTNVNAGIGTFTEIDFPPTPFTLNPSDGATDLDLSTNIVIGFNQLVSKGSGNITLRNGSSTGTVIETIDVTSGAVTIANGSVVTIIPSADLPADTDVYVVVDAGAFENTSNTGNTVINTYNFATGSPALGEPYGGGYLICKASGVRWVVAPSNSQVSRNWYARADANTVAQQVSGCTGWFVPSIGQLQNPGYTCRTYWDSYSPSKYWSNTAWVSQLACTVCFANGYVTTHSYGDSHLVRSFRCVTY